MNPELKVVYKVHFQHGRSRMLQEGDAPEPPPESRVPRISRLMALALRFDQLVRENQVDDYADIARLGHVTRTRVTQIMNLLNLAPDIQEAILFLPLTTSGRDPIRERQIRTIVAELDWVRQRGMRGEFVPA